MASAHSNNGPWQWQLELLFRNPAVLKGNVKIAKGDACQIMIGSTRNLHSVCEAFRTYVRCIHKKNDPRDPNFLAICARCVMIEQFIEILNLRQDLGKLSAANAKKPGSCCFVQGNEQTRSAMV
ncbi:hypothetical protein VE00_05097 [Pseudogymnoascus sp. WSF 3629]|nr:hypothetical protein VE00_05097 [Pseudogymnoascus sp. WSF 3629]